jgi:predicted  nucleic acid-binding Zn-ribbon protein
MISPNKRLQFIYLLWRMNSKSIIFAMSESFKLYRLQQIDSELDKSFRRINEIDLHLADDQQIRISQQELDRAKKAKFEAEKRLRHAEQNVKEQRIKIERSQSALYGGKVTNPKELQDLQHESESLRRYLNTLEDQQLEAMLAMDDVESDYIDASESLATTETQVAEQKTKLSDEKAELLQRIDRQQNERNAAAANIVPAELGIYETLRQQKNGIAVARIIEKTCGACGSTLSATIYSSAQVPSKITRCSTCGRILYAG